VTDLTFRVVTAFLAGLVLVPITRALATRYGIVARPSAGRWHRQATPLLGGIAIAAIVIAGGLTVEPFSKVALTLACGALIACLGLADDLRDLKSSTKLVFQIVVAAVFVYAGHRLHWVNSLTIDTLLTLVWIVGITNALNLLDGLDGLAAGVCGIAGATFSVIALSLGKPNAAVFSAIVFGATLGFLRHNFFPARVFMGDSGAMLLGFSLAAVSVEGLLKTAATVALFFPLLVLAVPILDTSFVVARRLKYRQPITAPDKAHLHHRFVNIGFSQPRAVVYIYFWVGTLAAAALGTRFIPFREGGHWHAGPTIAAAAIGVLAIAASVYMVYLLEIVKLANPRVRRRRREAEEQARRTA
jgi:UDP-GlcNAc:undecaprenyl-phosphate/decaprenyl-phosphate GlcNAc-1-phosphate transferase